MSATAPDGSEASFSYGNGWRKAGPDMNQAFLPQCVKDTVNRVPAYMELIAQHP